MQIKYRKVVSHVFCVKSWTIILNYNAHFLESISDGERAFRYK